MIAGPILAASVLLATQDARSAAADARTPPLVHRSERTLTDKELAEDSLKYVYTAYLALKACIEASRDLSKPEYMPLVSLDEARRIMADVDLAAREAGLDVEAAWIQAAPIARTTASALRLDKPGNAERCRDVGPAFGGLLYRLQTALRKIGGTRNVIEKDF